MHGNKSHTHVLPSNSNEQGVTGSGRQGATLNITVGQLLSRKKPLDRTTLLYLSIQTAAAVGLVGGPREGLGAALLK